jgi:hypothetical protein
MQLAHAAWDTPAMRAGVLKIGATIATVELCHRPVAGRLAGRRGVPILVRLAICICYERRVSAAILASADLAHLVEAVGTPWLCGCGTVAWHSHPLFA